MYLYVLRRVLDNQLCMKNYTECFHLLLHLEEIQMEVDIKKYDLHGKTMTLDKSSKKLLILKVSEKHNYLTPDVFLFIPDGLNVYFSDYFVSVFNSGTRGGREQTVCTTRR